jgi:hypothetical protein
VARDRDPWASRIPPNINYSETEQETHNTREFVTGIWHSLVSPQLGQTTFSSFFASELFVAELPVGFGPATSLSGRRLGIGDDGFGERLEVGMRAPGVFVVPPNFDELMSGSIECLR